MSPIVNGTLEYFVSRDGEDASDGLTRATAFSTIQRGLDALQAGDTLTILPGEYFGPAKREGLGNAQQVTTIRAELPGTVLMRGDVPLQKFEKVADTGFTYVTDLAGDIPAVIVNEVDTLRFLNRANSIAELHFRPGLIFHDTAEGKLYITSSDGRSPAGRLFTVGQVETHGLYLSKVQRVVVEGLAFTGFNSSREAPKHSSLNATWSMFLEGGTNCIIRNCRAWLNSQGIAIWSGTKGSGGNVMEGCVAWANRSDLGAADRGGLTLIEARKDSIRDSVAFLNSGHGINIRRGTWERLEAGENSLLYNNLSWGNTPYDFRVKGGYPPHREIERCIGHSWTLSGPSLTKWSIVGMAQPVIADSDTIILNRETGLVPENEFADPANHDYRLQATSRFRGSGPEGRDRGPLPYEPVIRYVKPDGNDEADGLSVLNAWRTPQHALANISSGETLYLLPGVYEGNFKLERPTFESDDAPVSVRGRDGWSEPVILRGSFTVSNMRADFQRLTFEGPTTLQLSQAAQSASPDPDLTFRNCWFADDGTCVRVQGVRGLSFNHCAFSGFSNYAIDLQKSSGLDLRDNLFANENGIAVNSDAPDSVLYAGYNSYSRIEKAWQLPGAKPPQEYKAVRAGTPNAGTFGKPCGPARDGAIASDPLGLIQKPRIYSLSPTTANIEWIASLPSTCELAWGDTSACTNSVRYDADYFGTFSLTGLKPEKTYYFTIRSLHIPQIVRDRIEYQETKLDIPPLAFTTPAKSESPAAYYVSTDGSDSNTGLERTKAWKTLQHAANSVKPGDTVYIAGGVYSERMRIRTTGAEDAPITFRSMPGERVIMDGLERTLTRIIQVSGKKHLRFDGFNFRFSNRDSSSTVTWFFWKSAEFQFYACDDIKVTRSFSDGRGRSTANFISALKTSRLHIKNSVHINKFSSLDFWDCPELLVENCAFVRPQITACVIRSKQDHTAIMRNNIFTDNLPVKSDLNAGFVLADGVPHKLLMPDNCFMIRQNHVPQERNLISPPRTIGQLGHIFRNHIFADPLFAGDPHPDADGFSADRLTNPGIKLQIEDFISQNPVLLEREIGLQPEAFADF